MAAVTLADLAQASAQAPNYEGYIMPSAASVSTLTLALTPIQSANLRLECVRLAIASIGSQRVRGETVFEAAGDIFDFVTGAAKSED